MMSTVIGALIVIAIFWGIPIYRVDTRARRNHRSPRKRPIIAILMCAWYMILPALAALGLAGPGEPGSKRHWFTSWLDSGRSRARASYIDYNHNPWQHDPSHQQTRRRREDEEEEQRQAALADDDDEPYNSSNDYDPDDEYTDS